MRIIISKQIFNHEISSELNAEPDSCLQAFEANPKARYSWGEIKPQIKSGTRRKISKKLA